MARLVSLLGRQEETPLLKRVIIVMALVLPMLAAGLTPLALAQGNPTNVALTILSKSDNSKSPHVDTFGSDVLVASNADESVQRLWRKADTATGFPDPSAIATTGGSKPDYYPASIFVSDTGVIYYAWINQIERRIYLRFKGPTDPDFRAASTVFGSAQPYDVEVAANEDGVFVFWREADGPIRYRRTSDGVSWASVPAQNVLNEAVYGTNGGFDLSAGAGRKLAVAYTKGRPENDITYLQGYLAIWNGSGFSIERIPTVKTAGFSNPSVALRPDGGWAVTIRGVDNPGVFVGDRLPSGAWEKDSLDRIAKGEVYGLSVDVDLIGNAHLFWSTSAPGMPTVYYAFRRPGQAYGGIPIPQQPVSNPLLVTQHTGLLYGTRAAASLRDRGYGHVVFERWNGDVTNVQYALVGLPVTLVSASGISIEGGAATSNKASVSVSFSGLSGNPGEVRWSWGAPPAASAPYSAFDPVNPTISVPLPAGVSPNCTPLTLYTQLKSGLYYQLTPNSDSIVVDQAMQADFYAFGNAPALDPRYTSTLSPTVLVSSIADCSGIATTTVSGPIEGGSLSLPVAGNPVYLQTVTLTGGPGVKDLSFVATDQIGNATPAAVTKTIIYDPEPPTLNSIADDSPSTLVANPQGTTEIRLALDGLIASDTGGVVAGIELQIVSPPGSGGSKTSVPAHIAFSEMDQVITNEDGSLNLRDTIDLSDFFAPADLIPGTYSFVIRVVDAAGNVSSAEGSVTRSEEITKITFPTYVSFIRR